MKLIEAKTITLKVVAVADYDFEKEIKFLLNIKIIVDVMGCHFEKTPSNLKTFKLVLREYLNNKTKKGKTNEYFI